MLLEDMYMYVSINILLSTFVIKTASLELLMYVCT